MAKRTTQSRPNRTGPARDDQRLQKVLAAAGLGSRRQCEELISAGRVEVDGEVVTKLGTRADTHHQAIRVDGVPLRAPKRFYYIVHKPPGVLSTARDQWGRTRVIDLIDSQERLFTVGRLDKASSGIILVTNDGELANQLAHPRYGVQKTYLVTVAGHPTPEILSRLRRGTFLADGPVRPSSVRVKRRLKQGVMLEIVLSEGRNREIRRMLARVGHKVMQLRRISLGPIKLGQLPAGSYRELTREELKKLRSSGGEQQRRQVGSAARRKPGRRTGSATGTESGKPLRETPRQGTVLTGVKPKRPATTPSRGHGKKSGSPTNRRKVQKGRR